VLWGGRGFLRELAASGVGLIARGGTGFGLWDYPEVEGTSRVCWGIDEAGLAGELFGERWWGSAPKCEWEELVGGGALG